MRSFSSHSKETFAALDIGTSKVASFVGMQTDEGVVELIGAGVVPSDGVRGGAVSNVRDASDSIRESLAEAEKSSGTTIRSVVVGIAGTDVNSKEANISQGFGERGREIQAGDVSKLRDRARAGLSEDEIALHVEPQEYVIDGRISTTDPIGMWGIKLDFYALVITASVAAVNNLRRCVRLAGAEATELVLEPVASAEAVLDSDEKLLGTAVLDLGGGTSDLAIYQRGALRATAPISMGGEAVTTDLAKVLGAPMHVAENLKISLGLSGAAAAEGLESIEVTPIGGGAVHDVPATLVSDVIRARLEEILEAAARALEAKRFREPLAGGVVLTGGTSRIKGLEELAERFFRVRTRCGTVRDIRGDRGIVLSPEHATGMGLLLRAAVSGRTVRRTGSTPGRIWAWIRERWNDLG